MSKATFKHIEAMTAHLKTDNRTLRISCALPAKKARKSCVLSFSPSSHACRTLPLTEQGYFPPSPYQCIRLVAHHEFPSLARTASHRIICIKPYPHQNYLAETRTISSCMRYLKMVCGTRIKARRCLRRGRSGGLCLDMVQATFSKVVAIITKRTFLSSWSMSSLTSCSNSMTRLLLVQARQSRNKDRRSGKVAQTLYVHRW